MRLRFLQSRGAMQQYKNVEWSLLPDYSFIGPDQLEKINMPDGSAKQVGYVITGKTEFDKGDYTGCGMQYIDLWVTILTVVDTVF